jgi:dUTPase
MKNMTRQKDPAVEEIFYRIIERYTIQHNNFAILKVAIQDPALKEKYAQKIEEHNHKMINNVFYDSGFDIFVPEDVVIPKINTTFIDHKIKTEMIFCETSKNVKNTPFLLHPRSSMSKLPIMLANHTGIIDSGYRGNIIGAFRNLDTEKECNIAKDTRLLQICHPSLCPIFVILVNETELSNSERGDGAFGSTGVGWF